MCRVELKAVIVLDDCRYSVAGFCRKIIDTVRIYLSVIGVIKVLLIILNCVLVVARYIATVKMNIKVGHRELSARRKNSGNG